MNPIYYGYSVLHYWLFELEDVLLYIMYVCAYIFWVVCTGSVHDT